MGRFFLILLLAVGIAGGVAWYCELGPFAPSPANAHPDPEDTSLRPTAALGKVLYAYTAPQASFIEDEETGSFIVVPDCHLVPTNKQDANSAKDGQLIIVGNPKDKDDPTAKALPTTWVLVDGKKHVIPYKRLEEGTIVSQEEVIALIDPTKALNDIEYKRAKIEAAKADHLAAIAMHKEAQARLDRLDNLRIQNRNLVSAEEYSGAVLTRDKHREEAVSKKEQVRLAEIEFHQAQADLRQHEIRCVMPGKSIVKQIYKNMGDGVKALETVIHLHNISRLRAEGAVEAQYFSALRPGMKVILEPSQDAPPEGQPLKAHRGEINGVAVAADGTIVSGSEDQMVCLWRRGQAVPVGQLYHGAAVRVVACSPNSKQNYCLAGLSDGRIVVWDLAQATKSGATPVREIKDGHRESVTALAFSPDGKWFASGGQDSQIILWDMATGQEVYRFDHEHGVDAPHQGAITSLHFTPQGKLVSAARDNTLRVWALHAKGARPEGEPVARRAGTVTSPGVSSDGELMVYDQGRTLQLLTVNGQQTTAVLQSPSAATQFETIALFSPDGSLLLTAGAAEGRLQLWRTPTRKSPRAFEVRQLVTTERSPVTCAAFAPVGSYAEGSPFAVSGSKDGYVYVWNLPTRQQVLDHRIRVNNASQPLTLTHVDQALDASKIRIGVNVDNPETPEFQNGRLIPGQRVTVVIRP